MGLKIKSFLTCRNAHRGSSSSFQQRDTREAFSAKQIFSELAMLFHVSLEIKYLKKVFGVITLEQFDLLH